MRYKEKKLKEGSIINKTEISKAKCSAQKQHLKEQ